MDAPAALTIVAGRRRLTAGARGHWQIDFPAQALGNVLIAASRFRTAPCGSECAKLAVTAFLAPYSVSDPATVQRYARQELNAYATFWHSAPSNRSWVAEMPENWSDAISYLGGAAINERLFDGSSLGHSLSIPIKMVMSHEIAHQWWGYGVVPFKRPGSAFILESFSQFAALRRMQDQRLLTPAFIYGNTQALSSMGRVSAPGHRLPLRSLTASDWQAYYEGPLMLMRADAFAGGRLMTALGEIQHEFNSEISDPVDPGNVIAALENTLPRSFTTELDHGK